MRTIDPSSPRLVWHGRDGRIELSGRVLDNWVAKSSNLLADELDAAEGTVIGFDLPVHWKTLALALACWQTGGTVLLAAGPDGRAADGEGPGTATSDGMHGLAEADIVLSSRDLPEVLPPRFLVGVALGPLALAWDGSPLPSGAVDYAAEVRAQGDLYPDAPAYDAAAPVLRSGNRSLTRADLAADSLLADAALLGDGDDHASPTVLLEPGTGLLETLATACSVWERDGAIVLVEHGVPVTDRLVSGERVTIRPGSA